VIGEAFNLLIARGYEQRGVGFKGLGLRTEAKRVKRALKADQPLPCSVVRRMRPPWPLRKFQSMQYSTS